LPRSRALVDVAAAQPAGTATSLATRKGVTDISFSPDGTRLVTAERSRSSAIVWNVGLDGGAGTWRPATRCSRRASVPSPTVPTHQQAESQVVTV
jgi:hypothetical protein